MPFLGKTAAVIPGNGCHHQMFRFRIAQKLSVTNQIPGVLVIRAEIDVLSAGVKHCCGPEQLPPLAIVVVHQTLCGVVQAQGMGRHPFSAPLIHRKALHLMDDSALTNAALKAETVLKQSMAEHLMVAAIARYHRRSLPKKRHESWQALVTRDNRRCVSEMALLLRLAAALDRRPEPVVASLRVNTAADVLDLVLVPERLNQNLSLEQWSLESCADVIREASGVKLRVSVQA